MARFRNSRRRSRSVWMAPAINTDVDLAVPTDGTGVLDASQVLVGTGPANVNSSIGVANPVNDAGGIVFEQNSFTVKRIVGSIFVACKQQSSSDILNVECFAGVFVDRVAAADAGTFGEPSLLNNWYPWLPAPHRKRWLFQRWWMLTNAQNSDNIGAADYSYPETNAEYGDIRSGPHVDIKSKARIGYEENLFWLFAARAYFVNPGETGCVVTFTPRVRVLTSRLYMSNER